jgi:hypothetical protein
VVQFRTHVSLQLDFHFNLKLKCNDSNKLFSSWKQFNTILINLFLSSHRMKKMSNLKFFILFYFLSLFLPKNITLQWERRNFILSSPFSFLNFSSFSFLYVWMGWLKKKRRREPIQCLQGSKVLDFYSTNSIFGLWTFFPFFAIVISDISDFISIKALKQNVPRNMNKIKWRS